jgi:hypothetical protein
MQMIAREHEEQVNVSRFMGGLSVKAVCPCPFQSVASAALLPARVFVFGCPLGAGVVAPTAADPCDS